MERSPHDSDYGHWLMNVSRLNSLPLDVPAVAPDGTKEPVTIATGDAYIHRDTGVILAFALTDDQGKRYLFALDHADQPAHVEQSREKFRDVIHALSDSWFFRSLMKASPFGRVVLTGGAVLRHFWRWDQEPDGTGYYVYPDGNLVFAGAYQLSAN